MIVFSHGRIRPMPRQSVLDLDIIGHLHVSDKEMASSNCSLGSGQSSSSSSTNSSPNSRRSYNTKLLHNIKRSGQKITPEDVYKLRREIQMDFAIQKTVINRKKCLRDAMETISELREELREEVVSKSNSLPFFVSEYQALICWIYTEIRFAPYMSELKRHFNNLKNEHRILLSALTPLSDEHILALLRFSNICLEYVPYCDEEALDWCRTALLTCEGRTRSSSSASLRCTSSLSSSSTPNSTLDVDDILARRDEQYRRDIERDLRININEIQSAMHSEIKRLPIEKLV